MQIVGMALAALFPYFLDFVLSFFNRFSRAAWYLNFQKYKIAFFIAGGLFFSALATLIYKIYDVIITYINLLNNSIVGNNLDTIGVGFSVLKSLGFFEALHSASSLFLPIPFTLFGLITLKITYNISRDKADMQHKSSSFLTDGDHKGGRGRFKKK